MCFVFSRQGLSMLPCLSWNSLCRPVLGLKANPPLPSFDCFFFFFVVVLFYFVFILFLRQGGSMQSWSLLCRPDWSQTHREPSAFACRLKAYATMPNPYIQLKDLTKMVTVLACMELSVQENTQELTLRTLLYMVDTKPQCSGFVSGFCILGLHHAWFM